MPVLVQIFSTGVVLMFMSTLVGAISVMIEDSDWNKRLDHGARLGLISSLLIMCGSALMMIWS